MERRFLITVLLLLVMIPSWGASYSLKPGLLASVLREIIGTKPETVVLNGEVQASELQSLKRLPSAVRNLDLSQLTIKGDDVYGHGELPPFALFATDIKTVILPNSLKIVGEGAFAETPLDRVTIPSGVGNIGPRAFYNCKVLKSVDMGGANIWEIKDECFSGCVMLEDLQLPQNLTVLGDRALMRTALRTLSIPNVWGIGRFALAEMPALSEITIKKVVEIGEGAFFNTPNLQAFDGFTFTSPALGFAMSGNAADGNMIDDAVIREGSFAGSHLSKIKIGRHVQTIEPHAFRNVEGLQTVDAIDKLEEIPTLSEDGFSGVDVSKIRLLVAPYNEEGWRQAPGWKDFMIEVPARVDEIAGNSNAITISGSSGEVYVVSEVPMEYVGIYSLSGMLLFERHDCGETLSAGPFADKEIVVRAVAGPVVKVATLQLN